MPLPSYIARPVEEMDADRYQNIFARNEGAVVTPAAGLHFSRELLKRMEIKGIDYGFLTLHSGLGNFREIDVEDLTKHKMDSEQMRVTPKLVELVNHAKDEGRKVCAVGTSVMRGIESAVSTGGHMKTYDGWTNKFIFPPYDFTVATNLVTNFHMPLSTMLMMVAAFGGYDIVLEAYESALKEGYRFGAYGDAMLILGDFAPEWLQVQEELLNGTAKKIVLTDAMPFEAPTAFHADAISYTRTIEESLTTNSQETTGWRGIVLPFDVSTIQARNKAGEQIELSAYNAEGEYDTSKNPFWLRELTTEGFAATQTFSANTPYIICFPNSSELDEHINIIGDVTFSASNAEITATPVFNAVEGKDFDMIATLQTVPAAKGIYAINNTGSSFVNNSRDIAPFECYVICKQGSTDAPDSFDLPAKLPTAIDNETVTGSKIYTADGNLVIISNEPTEIAVYNITGQMVLMQKVEAGKTIVNDIPHGVYIVNGQKIIL